MALSPSPSALETPTQAQWSLSEMPMLTVAAWPPAEAFAGKYDHQGAATSLGQFFAAYFSLFIILLLPKCSLRMKVESMTSMLCFLPVRWPPC